MGQYCIFRRGGTCPKGFDEGFIFWDDEDTNNANRKRGSLPDGVYNSETKIEFCCRNDVFSISFWSIVKCRAAGINLSGLPRCRELILMRHKGSCPTISGYRGPYTGYLDWDTEDSGNKDEFVGVFPDG
ncbi:Hypothetical predicted protein, partial [Paramuricea clavata]